MFTLKVTTLSATFSSAKAGTSKAVRMQKTFVKTLCFILYYIFLFIYSNYNRKYKNNVNFIIKPLITKKNIYILLLFNINFKDIN